MVGHGGREHWGVKRRPVNYSITILPTHHGQQSWVRVPAEFFLFKRMNVLSGLEQVDVHVHTCNPPPSTCM